VEIYIDVPSDVAFTPSVKALQTRKGSRSACAKMIGAGFMQVSSLNPYWDIGGETFEDIDGCRVVLQNSAWVNRICNSPS